MAPTEYTQGLRELADWLDENPQFEVHGTTDSGQGIRLYMFAWTREEFVALAKALGGNWDKDSDSGYYMLFKMIGPNRVELNISHNRVCERVQVGVKTVKVHDPEQLATIPMIEVEEPQYEWVCPPSILADVE